MTIRTRFAPSPTGFLHVGGIRTALFAYLLARQAGGSFILRFEDTDKKREVAGSREHLIESLLSLGIEFDEGPGKGGDYGPYVQSERLMLYKAWANRLIEQGRAYADPYTPEEVQVFRDQARANKKAFLFRDYRPDNPPVWDGSTPLRFKSQPRDYTFRDEVMGEISTGPEVIDDFILIKSDGYPTYNFAHIVDDHEMKITHVIRGQEFISSMPNYLNLYEALGYDMSSVTAESGPSEQAIAAKHELSDRASGVGDEALNSLQDDPGGLDLAAEHERSRELQGVEQDDEFTSPSQRRGKPLLPMFAHLPHIMNEQGNKKLGKRDGAKDVLDYLRDGYLPETMVAFIATLGWNDGTEQEVFTHQELIEKFSLKRIQRSGAKFDEKRLEWMNGQFIRRLELDELTSRAKAFWPEAAMNADESYRLKVLTLAQDRLKTLRDLPQLTEYFFSEPAPNQELITSNKQLKKLSRAEQKQLLETVYIKFSETTDWDAENIQDSLNQLLESTGQKPGTLFSLVRIVTTWAPFSPQLNDTLELLGRETTLRRMQQQIDFLS